jgi:hypothetical protein
MYGAANYVVVDEVGKLPFKSCKYLPPADDLSLCFY